MLRRILITAGGTGGHVYPALAVAEVLHAHTPEATLCFVGSVGGFERPLVAKSGVRFAAYDEVQAGPLHGINPLKATVSVSKLILGTLQALGVLARHHPQVILTTGGWVSFPVALAAWLRRLPLVIYLPDIEPGLTIKALRPFATKICVTTPDSAAYISAKQMIVTGYPLRQAVLNANRAEGIAHFKLDSSRKTILVTGGSRGAQSLNIAIIEALPSLLQHAVQVLHITGELDWERAKPLAETPHYHPFAYLHEDMGLALAASDLVVCRSGASALGELPHFGLASVLVPYPYAWRYQKVNADYLAGRGAGIYMADEALAQDLTPTLLALLNQPERLSAMQQQARSLAQPNAAAKIAQVLADVAKALEPI